MVKKFLVSLLVVMTGLIIISCNGLVTPSKIQVKGSPSLYAPLGSKTLSLSEYLKTDDIIKMMGADNPDSTMKVYEYPFTAGSGFGSTETFISGVSDNNMRFLVHYPLKSQVIDFSEYLTDLNFSSTVATQIPPQEFTVPTLESPDATEIDFNSVLLTSLNAITAFSVPVLATSAGSVTVDTIPITLTGFENATFSAGSMELVIDAGTTTGLSVSSVRILNAANVVLASSTGPAVALSGTVTIPLTGVTLNKVVKFEFTLSALGATSGALQVAPSFSANTLLSAATGVNISTTSQNIPSISVPAITDASFVEATIGAGNITLAIEPAEAGGIITGFTR
ncbi:MAG TPA: hypothetical protein VJ861_03685, partial [Treponemataceae bacterium]|nr:hypothetical protein [Treponemataceae bacterium]